jgi:DNA-directed RNA polymerase specialized sigma24 family protein
VPQQPQAITDALRRYEAGDRAASREIFAFAYPILTRYALRVLRGSPLVVADEDDIANTSLQALFCNLDGDLWPRSGDDLTRLLFTVAWRKINDRRKRAGYQHGEVAAGGSQVGERADPVTPPDLVELADEVRASKAALARHDPLLVRILEGQLAEQTNEQIAAALGVSLATVKRKIQRIRAVLCQGQDDASGA